MTFLEDGHEYVILRRDFLLRLVREVRPENPGAADQLDLAGQSKAEFLARCKGHIEEENPPCMAYDITGGPWDGRKWMHAGGLPPAFITIPGFGSYILQDDLVTYEFIAP